MGRLRWLRRREATQRWGLGCVRVGWESGSLACYLGNDIHLRRKAMP
jgi:hypothetical protein